MEAVSEQIRPPERISAGYGCSFLLAGGLTPSAFELNLLPTPPPFTGQGISCALATSAGPGQTWPPLPIVGPVQAGVAARRRWPEGYIGVSQAVSGGRVGMKKVTLLHGGR